MAVTRAPRRSQILIRGNNSLSKPYTVNAIEQKQICVTLSLSLVRLGKRTTFVVHDPGDAVINGVKRTRGHSGVVVIGDKNCSVEGCRHED